MAEYRLGRWPYYFETATGAVTEKERYLWILGLKTQCGLLVSARREDFTRPVVGQWLTYEEVDVRSLAIKTLKVLECILKSTRCPAGSQCRPIKTDPFPKQGTELKKNRPFPTVKHLRHCLNKHMNWIIMFQSRLQGSPFVMRKYRDVPCNDQTESGIWVREMIIFTIAKESLWHCACVVGVCQTTSTFRKQKKCRDNIVTTFCQLSDVQVVVRAVRCCKGSSDWWTFLTMNTTTICCDKV